jgi:hypothetical protein
MVCDGRGEHRRGRLVDAYLGMALADTIDSIGSSQPTTGAAVRLERA